MVRMLKFHIVEEGPGILACPCLLRMDTRCGDLGKNVGIAKMLEKNILVFRVTPATLFIIKLS